MILARGALESVDEFAAGFFAIPRREAELLDPQHRLFLELVWAALEDAAMASLVRRQPARISVYTACGANTYLGAVDPVLHSPAERLLAYLSNIPDTLPTRASYRLGLTGESIDVQTACSSSLVATYLACRALADGHCDVAIAGGVSIRIAPDIAYEYQQGLIYSRDGRCLPFDEQATGTVDGDGGGVVVLKRLDAAVAEGDHIYATIKGIAVNNDGAMKAGFTAPSVSGQSEVIAEALSAAAIRSATIGYVEAHGTATALGDPVEIRALTRAFGEDVAPGSCAVGSVKANIGHLGFAAGIAGLIKAALVVEDGFLPPSPYYVAANPEIDFDSTPFFVPTRPCPWLSEDGPRRAGVSAFGVGGTNAHAILEEAVPQRAGAAIRAPVLITLSAESDTTLQASRAALADELEERPHLDVADVAYSLNTGRAALPCRWSAVVSDVGDTVRALRADRIENRSSPECVARFRAKWMAGDDVDWTAWYVGESRLRVSLPPTPLERESYWAAGSGDGEAWASAAPRRAPVSEWLWARSWQRTRAPIPFAPGDLRHRDGGWLVVGATNRLGAGIIDALRGEDLNVAGVLADELDDGALREVRNIIFVCSDSEPADREALAHGTAQKLHTLFRLVRGLGEVDVATRLYLVTGNAVPELDGTAVRVEDAPLLAAAKVVPQEYARVAVQVVDLDRGDPEDRRLEQVLAEVADEAGEAEVGYRRGARWTPSLASVRPSQTPPSGFVEGGVYVVVGGLGRIGAVVARHLAERYRARVVLVSRHAGGETAAIVVEIRRVGGDALVLAADIADLAAMRAVCEQTVDRFGRIDGIFHLAGVDEAVHSRFMNDLTLDAIETILRPKALGALVLRELEEMFRVDVCVVFSSLSTVVGGIAFGPHAAANAFAAAVAASAGPRWLTIDWDAWKLAGHVARIGAAVSDDAITADEGIEVLEDIMRNRRPRTFVSTIPLNARLARNRRLFEAHTHDLATRASADAPSGGRSADHLRRTVADAVGEIVQAPVELDDDLIGVGCDSLAMLDLVEVLKQQLDVALTVADIWGATTIRDLAELCIDKAGVADGDDARITEPLAAS